jgi:hypothetical protein
MRIASWLFVACATLAAIGLFFPAIDANVGRQLHVKQTTLSLYQAASDRELARELLAVYRANHGQRVGTKLVTSMEPYARGKIKDALEDAHDASESLGGISDHDAKTIGTAVAVAIWLFLALQILMAGLVFVQAVVGTYRRGRLIVALILSIISAAMAGAIYYGCTRVVFEVNDEISYPVVRLGPGVTMLAIAAAGALVCAIALLALRGRASHR